MLSALLYLRVTSFKNWLLARVRRLRQPKYLIGAIVGCAYFYFFFFRHVRPPLPRVPSPHAAAQALPVAGLPAEWLPATTAFAAIGLLVFMTLMWVVPTQRAALGFTEAEIAFLFPAPITRRALVHFRLLSAQFRSLLGGTVMMLFSNRWTAIGGNPFTHAIGWWFIFSALNLHFSGANFTLTKLSDAGVGVWRRRLLTLAALITIITVTLLRLPAAVRSTAVGTKIDPQFLIDWIVSFANTAPLSWLLWPFELLAAPFLALGIRDFLLALGPALAVITLHYLWIVHTAVAFEDASIEYAQKRGARIAAWRSGQRSAASTPTKGRAAPFPLAGFGRPEPAFLWKNLLSAWPYFTVKVFFACAAVIVVGCLWLRSQPIGREVLMPMSMFVLPVAGYVLIVGPQFARQDIRSDMVNADILKTYPLAGWQIVLGELLAPIAILTGVLWLALLAALLTFHPARQELAWLTPPLRITVGLALAAITPALVTLQLLVPNAAALWFPGWFQVSRTRGGGPEVIGQRMIFFFAQLVTMLLALVPATAVAAVIIAILYGFLSVPLPVAVGVAACGALAVLLGEIWGGLWLLGRRFEKLDLSAELRS